MQRLHRTLGEALRRGQRRRERQFRNKVSAAAHRHLGAGVLVEHGKIAALDEIAAHHTHDNGIFAQNAPRFGDVVQVSRVERVVFGGDAADGHGGAPFSGMTGLIEVKTSKKGLYICKESCRIKIQHYYIGFRGFMQAAKYGIREFSQMKVLVINAGSSSLKYQLLDTESGEVMAKGLCERIGIDGVLTHTGNKSDEKFKFDIAMPTHKEAIQSVINILLDPEKGVISSMSEIDAVGHRVVHGGEFFSDSVIITEKVLKAIEDCVPLAPLHNPPNLTGIQACREVMGPDVPMVAVFDTAFHQTMPQSHYMYAIPYEYYEKYKIRRYGFHGTSHKYVSQQAAEMLGRPLEELRLITCHLGNGSSICAINGGKSFDTSMGFTPLDGLPMGTRAGNIDPAIIEFLAEHEHMDAHEVINILNKKSGMLGISGVSSDFRDLDAAVADGNARAALAKDMFNLSVKKIIGSYVAEMGGVDAIIFTAGVGENDRSVRWDVCEHLEYLGIKIDPEKNKYRGKQMDISIDWARVRVLVIPTNEELMIAKDTERLVNEAKAQ